MELLYTLLAERVASPLSLGQLTDPLKTSHKTISAWLTVFEKFCLLFRVRPYSRRIARSILKEPKLYFYDCRRVPVEGKRFENLVAIELKRATANWTDCGLGEFDLFYLRNKEQEEVDFIVTRDGRPAFMVEVKCGDLAPARALPKFQSALHIPAIQLVRRPGTSRIFRNGQDRILVADAAAWLSRLG
jgi:predicted AAA+ superfamily ATPase